MFEQLNGKPQVSNATFFQHLFRPGWDFCRFTCSLFPLITCSKPCTKHRTFPTIMSEY